MPKASKIKSKQGLTPKQKKVFDIIKAFIEQNGVRAKYGTAGFRGECASGALDFAFERMGLKQSFA